MNDHPLRSLPRGAMLRVAQALRAERLVAPFSRSVLAGLVPEDCVGPVMLSLRALANDGLCGRHMAVMLELLAEERAAQQQDADRLDLVLSPPELDRVDARDTSVVVRDLFRRAARSVVIVSFAVDAGEKARALFGELARRMDDDPALAVRLYANIHRKHLDETPSALLVRSFVRHFREVVWPGARLPEPYYDPRSLEPDGPRRAVLHAKCLVVDDRWTVFTSANFTEAAQERNIEAGVLLDDPRTAARMRRQLDGLVSTGRLLGLG